jgi:hypothetical protein
MEEGKNCTDYVTGHTEEPGRYQIPPDKPSQHWWKDTPKGTDKQN